MAKKKPRLNQWEHKWGKLGANKTTNKLKIKKKCPQYEKS